MMYMSIMENLVNLSKPGAAFPRACELRHDLDAAVFLVLRLFTYDAEGITRNSLERIVGLFSRQGDDVISSP